MITGAETLAFTTDPDACRACVTASTPPEGGELSAYQPRHQRPPAVG